MVANLYGFNHRILFDGGAQELGLVPFEFVITQVDGTATGISGSETFGTPVAEVSLTGVATGIQSSEAFGTGSAACSVTGTCSGIGSGEGCGTPVYDDGSGGGNEEDFVLLFLTRSRFLY